MSGGKTTTNELNNKFKRLNFYFFLRRIKAPQKYTLIIIKYNEFEVRWMVKKITVVKIQYGSKNGTFKQ